MNHPVASAGQQGCDDHAHADEHINENDGGAAVDVHGGRNLEPLLFDDKRRLIPGGYRSSYRAVAIWQLDRLDDLGAALSSPGGRMAELSVLSNCARAVSVEQVKQVREIVRDFPRICIASARQSAATRRRVRLGRADTARELEAAWRQVHRHAPDRCGSEGADRAELSALTKPTDKSDECELPDVCPCKGDCDHYHSRHQAQFCPGLGRTVAFIVVHSHER